MSKFDWPELKTLQPLPPGRENSQTTAGQHQHPFQAPKASSLQPGLKEGQPQIVASKTKSNNGKGAKQAKMSLLQKPVVPLTTMGGSSSNPRGDIGGAATSQGAPVQGTKRLGTPTLPEEGHPHTSRNAEGFPPSTTQLAKGVVGKAHTRPNSGGAKRHSVGAKVAGPQGQQHHPNKAAISNNSRQPLQTNSTAMQWNFSAPQHQSSHLYGVAQYTGAANGQVMSSVSTTQFSDAKQHQNSEPSNFGTAVPPSAAVGVVVPPIFKSHGKDSNNPSSQHVSPRDRTSSHVGGKPVKSQTKPGRLAGTTTVTANSARYNSNTHQPANAHTHNIDVGFAMKELQTAKRRLEEARRLVVLAGRGALLRYSEDAARPKDLEILSNFTSNIQAFLRSRRSLLQMRRREAILHLNQLTSQDAATPQLSPQGLSVMVSPLGPNAGKPPHSTKKIAATFTRPLPAPLDARALASQQGKGHRMVTPNGNPLPSEVQQLVADSQNKMKRNAEDSDDSSNSPQRAAGSVMSEYALPSGTNQQPSPEKHSAPIEETIDSSGNMMDSMTVRQLKQLYFDFYDAEAWSLADMATPMLGARGNTSSTMLNDIPPIPEDLMSEGSPSPQQYRAGSGDSGPSPHSIYGAGTGLALPPAYSEEIIEENIEGTQQTPRAGLGGFQSLSGPQALAEASPGVGGVSNGSLNLPTVGDENSTPLGGLGHNLFTKGGHGSSLLVDGGAHQRQQANKSTNSVISEEGAGVVTEEEHGYHPHYM